ncbi:MAG: hypothetical protein K1X75_02305 [Leptospirales bacterium]|nr:hypothetical protein [Leptospirales bacterium]
MSVSERQMRLIQAAARILVDELGMISEDALRTIGVALNAELAAHQTSIEQLNIQQRSVRAAFIRHVVHRVERDIRERHEYPAAHMKKAIEGFMAALVHSWEQESGA